MAEGLATAKVLVREKKHVVIGEDAPDGGEGAVEAEVDAADAPASRHDERARRQHAAGQAGVDGAFLRLERAAVFLAKPRVAESAALAVEEFVADARDLVGGDFDALPVVPAPGPAVVKEAALAVG